jgi:large subunit ribosomal protein L10
MPRTEKVEKVAELKQRITGSEAMFLTDFRGLTVSDVTELRRSLRESGTRFSIVKNTLMQRAAGDAGADAIRPLLEGPTAVAFVDGDPIVAAKSLVDAIRRFRTMELKGAYMEGRVLTAEQAQSLATIAPRDVMLSQLAGMAKAELSRAAYMVQALQSRFLSLLDAFREKLPGAGDELEAAAESDGSSGPAPEEQEEQPTSEPPEAAREESRPDGDKPARDEQSGEGKE